MIDSRYAMKYSMPHSVVHIVDNSMYTGELPTVVADDPSLYSTIVVVGTPMGEDNRVVKITRSDIAASAFGLGSLTTDDIKKYGQTVTYPTSVISQGAPVQLLRVTPEGSTYAVTGLIVQWRKDETVSPGVFHVRLKELTLPLDFNLERFKNKTRLHNALVSQIASTYTDEKTDLVWSQALLISFIGAGRGLRYNDFNMAINFVPQGKRPANVKYEVATIDQRISKVVERFTASLVNIDNSSRTDYVETINNTVAFREDGSSIVVPTVNEDAVRKVYNDYRKFYKEQLDAKTVISTLESNCYANLNINTFDLIYGNYIYEGDGTDTKLPFYQVDMLNTDIPRLEPQFRKTVLVPDPTQYDPTSPDALYTDIMENYTTGIKVGGVRIGDLYLNATGANNTKPMISVITGINQYTGSITSVTVPKVFALTDGATATERTHVKDAQQQEVASKTIALMFNDTSSGSVQGGSAAVKTAVFEGKIVENDVIAYITGDGFILYTVQSVSVGRTPNESTYTVGTPYDVEATRKALDWASMSVDVGNIIGRTSNDPAFFRIGGTVIDTNGDAATGIAYVNNYNVTSEDTTITDNGHRIKVIGSKCVFGAVPSELSKTDDIIGSYYDCLIYDKDSEVSYNLVSTKPADWDTTYTNYYTRSGDTYTKVDPVIPSWTTGTYYSKTGDVYTLTDSQPNDWEENYTAYYTRSGVDPDWVYTPVPLSVAEWAPDTYYAQVLLPAADPSAIYRYLISGVQGSIYRVSYDPTPIPADYYSDDYGINVSSELGGISLKEGSTGFFDDETMNSIEFKWKYSALLVKAYRGEIDPRLMSPTRVPAKYLFDGGTNTIVGQSNRSYVTYDPIDIINASSIFTEDEKEAVMYDSTLVTGFTESDDIDVKQAMYDFMVERCYQRIPEDKRPQGPGFGLQLNLDAGVTDANTAILMNNSFAKRFDNPNAVWDIGGYVDPATGISYTYVKRIADNLFNHIKQTTINKPFVMGFTTIARNEYISYFPDIDTTDWELRQLMYNSGGNVWVVNIDGELQRHSQRTLNRAADSSDLIQESNMRTLSQLCYLIQNYIDRNLLQYDDDGVVKTMETELGIMFTPWVGQNVESLVINFERDKNVDGGDLLVCYVRITFRGLILRVPIIVNVQARAINS